MRSVPPEKNSIFLELIDGAQSFRWVPITDITENDVTFPIDKRIIPMIIQHFNIK